MANESPLTIATRSSGFSGGCCDRCGCAHSCSGQFTTSDAAIYFTFKTTATVQISSVSAGLSNFFVLTGGQSVYLRRVMWDGQYRFGAYFLKPNDPFFLPPPTPFEPPELFNGPNCLIETRTDGTIIVARYTPEFPVCGWAQIWPGQFTAITAYPSPCGGGNLPLGGFLFDSAWAGFSQFGRWCIAGPYTNGLVTFAPAWGVPPVTFDVGFLSGQVLLYFATYDAASPVIVASPSGLVPLPFEQPNLAAAGASTTPPTFIHQDVLAIYGCPAGQFQATKENVFTLIWQRPSGQLGSYWLNGPNVGTYTNSAYTNISPDGPFSTDGYTLAGAWPTTITIDPMKSSDPNAFAVSGGDCGTFSGYCLFIGTITISTQTSTVKPIVLQQVGTTTVWTGLGSVTFDPPVVAASINLQIQVSYDTYTGNLQIELVDLVSGGTMYIFNGYPSSAFPPAIPATFAASSGTGQPGSLFDGDAFSLPTMTIGNCPAPG